MFSSDGACDILCPFSRVGFMNVVEELRRGSLGGLADLGSAIGFASPWVDAVYAEALMEVVKYIQGALGSYA